MDRRSLLKSVCGVRSRAGAQLMKPIAAQMTVQQMTDVAAYFASLAP
jgi:cytochrome c553